jgi:hypothetical protein
LKALALKAQGERTMSILTFGSTKQKRQRCKETSLVVQTKGGGALELVLYMVPFISEAWSVVPLKSITK